MSIKSSIDKFIPGHFGGKGLLNMLELLSKVSTLSDKKALANKDHNDKIWPEVSKAAMKGRFIEAQHSMTELRYGKGVKLFDKMFMNGNPIDGAQNTCGIISLYNAFEDLGLNPDMPKLLYDFERKGIILKGYFGSSFKQIIRYIKDKGLVYDTAFGKGITEEKLDYLQSQYKAFIMITYNDYRSVFAMMHTMCITDMGDGFQLHNSFDGGLRYPTLKDAVFGYNQKGDRKSKPIGIIGIRKNE